MRKLFPTSTTNTADNSESGYILIAVIFLVALVLVGLAVAAPKMAEDIRRDKEEELVHRGLQYTRAVRLYYRKTNSYPASLDQLEKTNNIRFLRKRYKDPITGKDEWRIIKFGQVKVPETGLFGAALPATGGAGGAAAGALSGAAGLAAGGSALNGGGAFNNGASAISGGMGGSNPGAPATGTSNSSGGAGGAATSSSATGTTTGSSSTSAFGNGINAANTNQTFGGAGMVGIASTSTKESIREYKKQKHYNEWEFVYDPRADRGTAAQNGTGVAGGGQQPALNGQPNVPAPAAPGGGAPGGAANVPQSTPPPQ